MEHDLSFAADQLFSALEGFDIFAIVNAMIGLCIFFFVFIIGYVILYFLRTLALYKMAVNLRLPHPKRALVPVIEYYMFGLTADTAAALIEPDFQRTMVDGSKPKTKSRSGSGLMVFKALEAGFFLIASVFMVSLLSQIPDIISALFDAVETGTSLDVNALFSSKLIPILSFGILFALNYGLMKIFSLVFKIYQIIVSYKLFNAYSLRAAALWAALSFVCEPISNICLFAIRNRVTIVNSAMD